MIASLNHSSSASSLGSALMSGATFTVRPSRQATEEHGRVLPLINAQANAAPLDRVLLAGDQVLSSIRRTKSPPTNAAYRFFGRARAASPYLGAVPFYFIISS